MSRERILKPKYLEQSYWDERFKTEENYDWLVRYDQIKELMGKNVRKEDRVLMLGCGSSTLSEEMYNNGYRHIVNVDFSPVCIEKMQEKCRHCPGMKWLVMDVKDLKFPDESFDVVVEKATLDSLLSQEEDPWRVSDAGLEVADQVFMETSRVLKPDGHFISITFAQPHFRRPLLARAKFNWSVDLTVIEGFLPFFYFVMVKGQFLSEDDVELERQTVAKRMKETSDADTLHEQKVYFESPNDDDNAYFEGFDLWQDETN